MFQKLLIQLKELIRLHNTPTIHSERLWGACKLWLGKDASPNDNAPDNVACAESVTYILNKIYPHIPIITGTYTLWQYLEKSNEFMRVTVPLRGDIIMSPTGTGNGKIKHGHVGIIGELGLVYSNNWRTGNWDNHMTIKSWTDYLGKQGGYKIYYYRKVI